MISQPSGAEHDHRLPNCPACGGTVDLGVTEMVLSTNRGYRFPRVLVQWCPACDQSVHVELEAYERRCACDAHLETDMADHGHIPSTQQLVTVVFESCSACGQVREVMLNH